MNLFFPLAIHHLDRPPAGQFNRRCDFGLVRRPSLEINSSTVLPLPRV
jgi:hypothetical protein